MVVSTKAAVSGFRVPAVTSVGGCGGKHAPLHSLSTIVIGFPSIAARRNSRPQPQGTRQHAQPAPISLKHHPDTHCHPIGGILRYFWAAGA